MGLLRSIAASRPEYLLIKQKQDFAILNAADPEQEEIDRIINAQVIKFSSKRVLQKGIFIKKNNIDS